MRVLVCGGRGWRETKVMVKRLAALPPGPHVLIHGDCRGADRMGAEIGKAMGWHIDPYPADWDRYGTAAGPIRNRQMLREGRPDLVLAFHHDLTRSTGTADMVAISLKVGLEVEWIDAFGGVTKYPRQKVL